MFNRFVEGKFFLQMIVSAADHYYALRIAVRKISFLTASRSSEARSVGAGGLSSNMDPFYWHDRLGRPSYVVFATSRTSPTIRKYGQRGWWIGSRRRSGCVALPRGFRRVFACGLWRGTLAGTATPPGRKFGSRIVSS